MLSLCGGRSRLCDAVTRREVLRTGGLSAFGLPLSALLRDQRAQAEAKPADLDQPPARAKNCIVLFLMGGPAQQSTWDPKPDAPAEVRGPFAPIATSVPGIHFSETLPLTAQQAHHLCVLRAVSSGDNAHSSSGYYMITGRPHAPMNFENANPGPPNDFPSMGGMIRSLNRRPAGGLPSAVSLPHRIFNTDGSVWPGQDAGFLGRPADPWLVNCAPADKTFQVHGLTLPAEMTPSRLIRRQDLLRQFERQRDHIERQAALKSFDADTRQAFSLLSSSKSADAFCLDRERDTVRERYGRSPFGQSVLLSRRLIEADVKFVQVNWYRGPDEPMDSPCWDSHVNEAERMKTVLAPAADRAISALIEDLAQRGMLRDTLVLCMAEFGRSPRINAAGGRDHWGSVYSIAMAGGGVIGGRVYGASDALGGQPKEDRVKPEDITATVFDCLGYRPETAVHDTFGRPLAISTGAPIAALFS